MINLLNKIFRYDTTENIPEVAFGSNQFIFDITKKILMLDLNGSRYSIGNKFIENTQQNIIQTPGPDPDKFYYATDTGAIFRYTNNKMRLISAPNNFKENDEVIIGMMGDLYIYRKMIITPVTEFNNGVYRIINVAHGITGIAQILDIKSWMRKFNPDGTFFATYPIPYFSDSATKISTNLRDIGPNLIQYEIAPDVDWTANPVQDGRVYELVTIMEYSKVDDTE